MREILFVPVLLIVLAIPLILEKIPRNPIYGFRTRYTMSSNEIWYRANKISGLALLAAGAVWLGVAVLAPRVAKEIGIASVLLGVAISVWLVYRGRRV